MIFSRPNSTKISFYQNFEQDEEEILEMHKELTSLRKEREQILNEIEWKSNRRKYLIKSEEKVIKNI
jgi:hypothetical protein